MRRRSASALCAALTVLMLINACARAPEEAVKETTAEQTKESVMASETTSASSETAAIPSAWPSADELPRLKSIPDIYLKPNGERVASPEEFSEQTEYLRSALEHYIYGTIPPLPDKIEVTARTEEQILNGSAIQIYESLAFNGLVMDIRITYPAGAKALPVIMKLDYLCGAKFKPEIEDEMLLAGKYAFVTIQRRDLYPENGPAPAAIEAMGLEGSQPGAIAIWAYGAMVCLSHISDMDFCDAERIALTGHSRDGKAAVCAAAMDERFAAVIPNGSGCGGAGSFYARGGDCETLGTMASAFPYWLTPALKEFLPSKSAAVPADMLFARALIAEHGCHVLCTEAEDDKWANPYGTYVNTALARELCDFIGRSDIKNGMVIRKGEHNQTAEDWTSLIAFTDEIFCGAEEHAEFYTELYEIRPASVGWTTPERN